MNVSPDSVRRLLLAEGTGWLDSGPLNIEVLDKVLGLEIPVMMASNASYERKDGLNDRAVESWLSDGLQSESAADGCRYLGLTAPALSLDEADND